MAPPVPDDDMLSLVARSNFSQHLGFTLEQAGDGHARAHCLVAERHLNTSGFCHGGVITSLCDMTAGVATKSRLEDPAQRVVSVSLTVNFQRPGRPGRTLIADARVQSGRRIVSCTVDLVDDEDVPIANALVTLHVG